MNKQPVKMQVIFKDTRLPITMYCTSQDVEIFHSQLLSLDHATPNCWVSIEQSDEGGGVIFDLSEVSHIEWRFLNPKQKVSDGSST